MYGNINKLEVRPKIELANESFFGSLTLATGSKQIVKTKYIRNFIRCCKEELLELLMSELRDRVP